MKILKWIAAITLGVVVVGTGLIFYGLTTYADISRFEAWTVKGMDETRTGPVQVRYGGVSTLTITDGETTIMTDGFFSRPQALQLLLGKVEPDVEAISYGLEKMKVDGLAAIIAVHSHYDHAMDTPEVAKRTGAMMIGSKSTANIGRGWGLPEEQIHVATSGEPMRFGAFTVTLIASKHFTFTGFLSGLDGGERDMIDAPLVPPVKATDYRVGVPYAVLVDHPKGTILIQGSAGIVKDGLKGINADVVMLGIGALGTQTADYGAEYFDETADMVGAARVFAIHGDDLTGPLEVPFRGAPLLIDSLLAATVASFEMFETEMKKRPDLSYGLLPRWDAVTLFE